MKKERKRRRASLRKASPVGRKRRKAHETTLEMEYIGVFRPSPLPFQEVYTENETLEQPSPLTDYPSTATPGVGVSVGLNPRQHAKLEPVIY